MSTAPREHLAARRREDRAASGAHDADGGCSLRLVLEEVRKLSAAHAATAAEVRTLSADLGALRGLLGASPPASVRSVGPSPRARVAALVPAPGDAIGRLCATVEAWASPVAVSPPTPNDFNAMLAELRKLGAGEPAAAPEVEAVAPEAETSEAVSARNGDDLPELRRLWSEGGQKKFDSMSTLIFDCDGVLWSVTDPEGREEPEALQHKIVERVNKALRDEAKRVLFVTNNSQRTRRGFVEKLSGMGVSFGDVSDEKVMARAEASVVSAGFGTAILLKQMGIKRPFVLTSTPGLLEELDLVGISEYVSTFDKKKNAQKEEYLCPLAADTVQRFAGDLNGVDAVVVGWDFHLNALTVGLAVNALRWSMEESGGQPIPLITCSSDSGGVLGSLEDGRKIRAVGNGAMGHAIASCFDPPLEQLFHGKPSPTLRNLLLESQDAGGFGVDPATAVMIGDTIETDVEFANSAGMHSLFVLTGVNSLADMSDGTDPRRRSTWVLPSFADA